MKLKTFFLLLTICCMQIGFAETTENQKDSIKEQSTPKTKKYQLRHWSIAFNGGIGMLDGDIEHSNKLQIIPSSYVNFAFNAQVEYFINPVWGIYLQYNYLPYSASIKDKMNLKALTHDITINGSINIVNLFKANKNVRCKWGLNINVGAGCSFYSGNSYEYNEKRTFDNLLEENAVHGRTFVIPVGLSVEYSPVEALGIFLQAEYRMYQKDKLEGILAGQCKDAIAYAGIGLRYKIGGNKKHMHAKTGFIAQKLPPIYEEYIENNKKAIEELSKQVDDVTDVLNDVVIPRIETLENSIETDTDKDGVPDSRDRHPNTVEGSYVNYYGEPLTKDEIAKIMSSEGKPNASIYFEVNSYKLTSLDLIEISKIANDIQDNPNCKIEIIGYCDNTGPDSYNSKLSLERTNSIKNVLVEIYNIDPDRITTIGKGKLKEPIDKFIVNRRCDIYIK